MIASGEGNAELYFQLVLDVGSEQDPELKE